LAQATKKRAAASRRKKAPASRKAATANKTAGRITSRRVTSARRETAGASRNSDAESKSGIGLSDVASVGHMVRLFREVGGIVCLFAALIALLALASFDVADPGWSHTGVGSTVQNSVGRVGAWFADVTLYLFGYMAYMIPLVIGTFGWLLFRTKREASDSYRPFVFIQIIGVALMLISASGLADLHFSVGPESLPQGTFGGGILGTAVAWRLVPYLQHLGTTLVLLAAFFSSLTLAFGTSWIRMLELIGAAVLKFVDGMRSRWQTFAQAHNEHNRILAADRARESHLQSTSNATQAPAKSRKRAYTRGADETATDDPLLDDAASSESSVAVGMGAALAMAREKARASQELAGRAASAAAEKAVETVAAKSAVDKKKVGKFDVLGESLGDADALLTDDFDQTVQIEPAANEAPEKKIRHEPKADLPVKEVAAPKKKIAIKSRVVEQKQATLFLDVPDSDLPPLSLLDTPEPQRPGFSEADLEALSRLLEEKLAEFRITVQVVAVHPGPVITRFEMELAPGIKASRITGLSQDIARSMSLVSVRVVEVIAGKSTIGIEVPNDHREIVQLTEMLQSDQYLEKSSPLTLALGKDISGTSVLAL